MIPHTLKSWVLGEVMISRAATPGLQGGRGKGHCVRSISSSSVWSQDPLILLKMTEDHKELVVMWLYILMFNILEIKAKIF